MSSPKNFLQKRKAFREHKEIQESLALHHRGEVRRDGLSLNRASHRLEIEWRARDIHPWDRTDDPEIKDALFAEQSAADADAVLSRLFKVLPEIDVIEFRVIHPDSCELIVSGTVERSDPAPETPNVSARTRLWRRGVTTGLFSIVALVLCSDSIFAQSQLCRESRFQWSSTSIEFLVIIESAFKCPGIASSANFKIGIGHTLGVLKKDPIGEELTLSYPHNELGTLGFLHAVFGGMAPAVKC